MMKDIFQTDGMAPLHEAFPWVVGCTDYCSLSCLGPRGLFRGMNITILREVPAYMGQFYVYEVIKRAFTPEGGSPKDLGPVALMLAGMVLLQHYRSCTEYSDAYVTCMVFLSVAGGLAGISAWLLSYPQDIIKSRIQVQPKLYPPHPLLRFDGGLISCAKQINAERGFRGFWVGFGPCAARAMPANAVGFLAYELVARVLKDA